MTEIENESVAEYAGLLWRGRALGISAGIIREGAELLGVSEALLRAVLDVEASGEFFRADGTLSRRFEPHLMPGSSLSWRRHLRTSQTIRDEMFLEAFREFPSAALRATSWGAAQILGRNYRLAGFDSAREMVAAFADSADAQIQGLVLFLRNTGLDSALRAEDWEAFAAGYNGTGQVERYSRLLREAVGRRRAGGSWPVVSLGDRGAAVRRVQRAVGVVVDGLFGKETRAAVIAAQREAGLVADGVVGAMTWQALGGSMRGADRPPSPSRGSVADRVEQGLSWLSGGQVALGGIMQALPASLHHAGGVIVLVGLSLLGAVLVVHIARSLFGKE